MFSYVKNCLFNSINNPKFISKKVYIYKPYINLFTNLIPSSFHRSAVGCPCPFSTEAPSSFHKTFLENSRLSSHQHPEILLFQQEGSRFRHPPFSSSMTSMSESESLFLVLPHHMNICPSSSKAFKI